VLSKGGSAENERKARVAANLRALADDADKVRAYCKMVCVCVCVCVYQEFACERLTIFILLCMYVYTHLHMCKYTH